MNSDSERTDLFYRFIAQAFHIETRGWAFEAPKRVMRALGAVAEPYEVAVLWSNRPLAFTAPGKFIYVSRELLSRGLTDAGLGFVIAHEIAHHQLGHLGEDRSFWAQCSAIVKRNSEQEFEADAWADHLCRRTEYGGQAAEDAFDLLRRFFLDYRHAEAVYDLSDLYETDAFPARVLRKYFRSHPPIDERLKRLRESNAHSNDTSKRRIPT